MEKSAYDFRSGDNLRKTWALDLHLTGRETKGQGMSYQNSQSTGESGGVIALAALAFSISREMWANFQGD